MALKLRTRLWLDAASAQALDELRTEVRRLALEVGTLRSRAEEQEALRQREAAVWRENLAALDSRFEAHADASYATVKDLADFQQRIDDKNATIEEMRLGLAGLTEQLRWESEDLRKSLAAIIERYEGQRDRT